MTSDDDAARAVMRAYAENLRPPPVAEVISHAEQTRDAPHLPGTIRPRRRGRLVFAAAAVAAAIAAVAIVTDQLPDRGTAAAPAATQPAAGTSAGTGLSMAPGCPAPLPMLDEPADVDGKALKAIEVKAGQRLTLTAPIHREMVPESPLLSYEIYLLPPGTDPYQRAKAVAQSEVLQLTPDQQSVSPAMQIPTGLTPGTYDLVGSATFSVPSVCGVKDPDSKQIGRTWGVLASVVIIK